MPFIPRRAVRIVEDEAALRQLVDVRRQHLRLLVRGKELRPEVVREEAQELAFLE